MRSVSSAFAGQVLGSHRIANEAVVIDGDGVETPVSIISGTVTLDQRAAVRGRCDVAIVDDGTLGLVPSDASSLLAPYGNEIRLGRGVTYPDGTTEVVNLGVFGIQDTEVDDAPDGLRIRVAGLDRSARFVAARFESPFQITAGTNYVTAIETVLQSAWPGVPTNFTSTTQTTPSLIAEEGSDRWAFAQSMAQAIGMTLYFDGDGVAVLVPDLLSDPALTLAEGANGVLLTAGRRWTRESAFNRVVATGENTGEAAPSRGVATDDNPLSPTYYYGPFGKAPRFFSSPFLATDVQAQAAAQSILYRELGTTEQVQFGALVLPHLEPGDTVRVTRPRAGIDEDHVLDSLTIPMSADGAMNGQTRARQIA